MRPEDDPTPTPSAPKRRTYPEDVPKPEDLLLDLVALRQVQHQLDRRITRMEGTLSEYIRQGKRKAA